MAELSTPKAPPKAAGEAPAVAPKRAPEQPPEEAPEEPAEAPKMLGEVLAPLAPMAALVPNLQVGQVGNKLSNKKKPPTKSSA